MKIKITGLILTTLILCNAKAIAQNIGDQREDLKFGVKAGINLANVYDTEAEDFRDSYKTGFAGGIFLSVPIGRYLGVQPEVLYSQKGYKGSGSILTADYRYVRGLDYIDIPILLQVKPSPFLTLTAGPFFSWLLKKRIDFRSGTISIDQEREIEDGNIRKNTMGLAGGLDINLYPVIISGRIGFDLRDNNGDGTSTDPRYKNTWFQATLGLAF